MLCTGRKKIIGTSLSTSSLGTHQTHQECIKLNRSASSLTCFWSHTRRSRELWCYYSLLRYTCQSIHIKRVHKGILLGGDLLSSLLRYTRHCILEWHWLPELWRTQYPPILPTPQHNPTFSTPDITRIPASGRRDGTYMWAQTQWRRNIAAIHWDNAWCVKWGGDDLTLPWFMRTSWLLKGTFTSFLSSPPPHAAAAHFWES